MDAVRAVLLVGSLLIVGSSRFTRHALSPKVVADSDVLAMVLQKWSQTREATPCSENEFEKVILQEHQSEPDTMLVKSWRPSGETSVTPVSASEFGNFSGTLSCARRGSPWFWKDSDWSIKPLGPSVGVSGAAMYVASAGGVKKLLIKSVSSKEQSILPSVVSKAARRVRAGGSVLPNIFGVIKLEREQLSNVYMVTDFVGLPKTELKFDLKGTYINRLSSSPEQTTRMDEDFLREQRVLHLAGPTCEAIYKDIKADSDALGSAGVVDYSLFMSEACLTSSDAEGHVHPKLFKSLKPSSSCPKGTDLYYSFGMVDLLNKPFASLKRMKFFFRMRFLDKNSVALGPGVPAQGYATRFTNFFAQICPFGDTALHLQLATRSEAEAALGVFEARNQYMIRTYDVDGDTLPSEVPFDYRRPRNLWDWMYYHDCNNKRHTIISFADKDGEVNHEWICVSNMDDVNRFLQDVDLADAREFRGVTVQQLTHVEDGAMSEDGQKVKEARAKAKERGRL